MSSPSRGHEKVSLTDPTARERDVCYEEVVERYWGRVYGVALRILRNEADARDAAQDVFIKVYRHADSFEGRSRIFTWLYRITVNASLKRLDRRSRRGCVSLEELSPDPGDDGGEIEAERVRTGNVEDLAARRQIRELVRSAIDELPDSYRVPLLLRDIEELSTREAAGEMGLTEGALKVRLHRARKALRKKLEPILAAA